MWQKLRQLVKVLIIKPLKRKVVRLKIYKKTMNKKLIISLSTIGVVAAIVIGGTIAYFKAHPQKTGRVPQINTVHEEIANNYLLRKIMTNSQRKVLQRL